jgi:hypothetical protein
VACLLLGAQLLLPVDDDEDGRTFRAVTVHVVTEHDSEVRSRLGLAPVVVVVDFVRNLILGVCGLLTELVEHAVLHACGGC